MKIIVSRTETKTIDADHFNPGFVLALYKLGFFIQEIDGKALLGICEYCGMPVLDGDDYREDEDSIIWHTACEEK